LATPQLNKLASGRRNTRQNPDDKQTTPVSDPEKILKPRGFLKQATAVYQPKSTQSKAKIPLEPLTPQEVSTQILFGETSANTVEAETINPKLVFPEIKTEAYSTTSCVSEGKKPIVKPTSIDIPSSLEINFPTSQSLEEYTIHSDSTPAGSPIYISCKSEEPSPRISFPPFSVFSSPDKRFSEPFSLHPEEAKGSYTSLKTLFITYQFPLLEYLWLLSEEEEGAVKGHPHPPEFSPK
jgi:hypothetical protein